MKLNNDTIREKIRNKDFDNIENWDVSGVTDMSGLFNYMKDFDLNINNWNVSNVTAMRFMFHHCNKFNQDIGNWILEI